MPCRHSWTRSLTRSTSLGNGSVSLSSTRPPLPEPTSLSPIYTPFTHANRRDTILQTIGVRRILHKPISGPDLVDAVSQVLAAS